MGPLPSVGRVARVALTSTVFAVSLLAGGTTSTLVAEAEAASYDASYKCDDSYMAPTATRLVAVAERKPDPATVKVPEIKGTRTTNSRPYTFYGSTRGKNHAYLIDMAPGDKGIGMDLKRTAGASDVNILVCSYLYSGGAVPYPTTLHATHSGRVTATQTNLPGPIEPMTGGKSQYMYSVVLVSPKSWTTNVDYTLRIWRIP